MARLQCQLTKEKILKGCLFIATGESESMNAMQGSVPATDIQMSLEESDEGGDGEFVYHREKGDKEEWRRASTHKKKN